MKKARFTSKKLALVLMVLLLTVVCVCVSVSAADTADSWTFSASSVSDPMYVKNYFDKLPRAYEAVINLPSGSYSNASPIISNYPNNDTRDCFGFEITAAGKPAIYYYETSYTPETNTVNKIKTHVPFNYDVRGKGTVRLAVVNEIVNESPVYKLYVNGILKDTVTSKTAVHNFDPVYSQSTTRELSFGSDGKNYFKGTLYSVAVYSSAITADDAAASYKSGVNMSHTSLMAYYDASVSGNADGFIKDQSGNGHDASKAFFERRDALKDYAYSFAFVGDTQFLVYRDASQNTTTYTSPIYDWIVQNKDSKKIQYVLGMGDVTDRNEFKEWEYAVKLHEKLSNAGLPYAVIPGNHDDFKNYVKYNDYFGEVSAFTDNIDGYYKDGRVENYYMNFEVGEHKYMIIALQYGAPDEVLVWANKVVGENPDRKVIVTSHSFFDYEGKWSVADTREQTTTSIKTFNNGIDMWNDFISLHENIIIAASGHVDPEHIKHGTSVGVHGNTVNTFLIDPQGLDKATEFKTGMVAMFYFSEDGRDVQVEYISATKTLAAQAKDPSADDILFHEINQFSFKIGETEAVSQYTEYGALPESCYTDGNKFAIFSNGAFLGGYKTWNSATQAVANLFGTNKNANVEILMLADHDNVSDGLVNNALNYANGKITIDLGGHTFTRSGTFLNLNNYSDISNVSAANIVVKNGTVRSKSGPIINNQITNQAYSAEKTWNVTFENVTLGYAEGITGANNGAFYQAWTNSATADESQLGAITNITLNNCQFDLKTNKPTDAVTLFALADNRSLDKVDVHVRVNGGSVLADIADLANVTFYNLNAGSDTILFGADSSGKYTKLLTHTTERNYAHYSAAFPASDGNRYFVEIADDGTNSTYELQSLTISGDDVKGTINLGSNIKYLSAIDYPFAVFDQTGKFYGAFDYLLGNQGGAIGNAIYTVMRDKNDYNTAIGKYNDDANTAYILMRADYTMRTYTKSNGTEAQEYHNNLSHAQGNLVIDMRGYSIIADKNRTNYIFDATAKIWTGSEDGVFSFPSYYTVKNGSFKVYSAAVLRYYASNKNNTTGELLDVSGKLMSWTFNNVEFGLLEGATAPRFFHISNSAGGTSIANIELHLNDCVFDLSTNVPTKELTVFCTNFIKTTHMKADITVNGGKILAKNLDKIVFTNFDATNGSTMLFGAGSDGKYLTVVLPRTASTSKFNSVKVNTKNGTELIFSRATEAAKSTYTFCIKTEYGNVSAEYENTANYPFFVFKSDGTFVGAYSEWGIDSGTQSALAYAKAAGSVILLRRDYNYNYKSQYNNLSQSNTDIIIDLGGFTFTCVNRSMLMAQKKTNNDTSFTIKNGSVILGPNALIRMDTATSSNYTKKNGFTFVFENLNIILAENAATSTLLCYNSFKDGEPDQFCKFTYNNCTFDVSKVNKDVTMFDMSDARCEVTAVINGGEIITSGYALTLTNVMGGNAKSSLTFGKMGKAYTKLTIPSGAELPITSLNDGSLTPVKISVGTNTTTYQFAPTSLTNYIPKVSITLANELVLNVYVPVTNTQKFEFNGETYDFSNSFGANSITLGDGKDYYIISVPLGSSEAAKEFKLKSTVVSGENTADVSFTFSIPRYAEKVLNSASSTDVEKTLAKDVLAYVKAAYNYFTSLNTAEEITRVNTLIESIIGDYTATPTSSGTTENDADGIVTDVTLNLDSKPTIRFYVTDMNVTFKVGNKTVKTIKNEAEKYVELDVYAYALSETVTFGNGGSYHISDFVTGSLGQPHEELVKAFVKYAESAADYRASVIGSDN